jgi:hydroxymethylbilane synthase
VNKPFIIGTRGSDLALWQARHVQDQLQTLGAATELLIIKTQGDQVQHLSLDKLEGKGFFTKEIEDALLKGTIDVAVHSHKDLETEQPEGLTIGAVSERAAPNDVLLVHPNAFDPQRSYGVKHGASIGTGSARRKAQMKHIRPDIALNDIRGNVPTRVQKLREGHFDAILMAKAGLDRLALNLSDLHVIVLDTEDFVPAPAQGVLAIQCRSNDQKVLDLLRQLDNRTIRDLIDIERTVLNRMEGGCHLPLGVFAEKEDEHFVVHVAHASEWDQPVRKFTFISDEAAALPEMILQALNEA